MWGSLGATRRGEAKQETLQTQPCPRFLPGPLLTNQHRPGGLIQHSCVPTQVWRPEGHNQVSAGWGPFGDTEVGPPPGFFLASRGSQPPWNPSTCNCITLLPSSQGLLPGLCGSSPLIIRTLGIGVSAHPKSRMLSS